VTHALHHVCGLSEALAPYATRQGTFSVPFNGYTVAVFPFIDGTTVYERGITAVDITQAAQIMADLHGSAKGYDLPLVQRETFNHPFEPAIRRALAAAHEQVSHRPHPPVCDLLLAEEADLLATLALMREFLATTQRLDLTWVPTHSDPNWANFLVDGEGTLHLTDWGEVAWGPLERDLNFFTGPTLEPFLRQYTAPTGPISLHETLFAFYSYRWALQEIADYTTRLLFTNTDLRENAHAWTELSPYLPIPHAAIRESLDETRAVVERMTGCKFVNPLPLDLQPATLPTTNCKSALSQE
jgi:hypothetical protein